LKTFGELDLITPVQRALADENYETPTPIQSQTIPAAIEGRDILGCAQTGTGKTAAFAVPILHRLGQDVRRPTPNRPAALILAPTRELAIQIGESFATYGKHLKLKTALVYGGVNQNRQVRTMNQGAHILVATPGRLLDLMNQGHIELNRLQVFVLDEADRMLDMGFLPDLKRIIRALPVRRQSLFFSATLPPKIMQLAQRLLKDAVSVNVTPKTTSVERITQHVLFVEPKRKPAVLRHVLSAKGVERAIVFTRTKRGANMLSTKLTQHGIRAAVIHGNKSQNARQRALDAFRSSEVRVLVATDVAARGIDIDGVTHVVNFDLPVEPECYVHRIGRTGRAGAEGVALSFCSQSERQDLRAIEQLIGQKIPMSDIQPPTESQERRESRSGSPASQNSEDQTTRSNGESQPQTRRRPQRKPRAQVKPRRRGGPRSRTTVAKGRVPHRPVQHGSETEGTRRPAAGTESGDSAASSGNGTRKRTRRRKKRPADKNVVGASQRTVHLK
jgi:ATP-dependent RNA helicase RhlE